MKTNIDIIHFMPQTKWQKDKDLRFWNIKTIIAFQKIATVELWSFMKYSYTFLKGLINNLTITTFFYKSLNIIIHFVILLGIGGRSEWIGDDFCDDINNNEKCLYDDGDCCGLSAQKNFCFKCTCKGK